MIRHHTVLSKPMIAYFNDGEEINHETVVAQFEELNSTIRTVAKARLTAYSSNVNHLKYKPVGYVLSSAKDAEDEKLRKRAEMIEDRMKRHKEVADERVVENNPVENS